MTKILLLQGANMVWLGQREPELYGTTTANELDAIMRARAASAGITLDIFYANIEGEAIARIYQAVKEGVDGLLMNPAGFTYAGFALRDCIKAVSLPYVEVHMTNIERRGTRSVLAEVANGVVTGLGISSYLLGLDGLLNAIEHEL
ncbi:MAG: type II 3-dehydroquinate dehydratase [Pseudomonadota bacterium]|jgi:3-dehydroquinate dehydratase-2|nr:type II 3-dehydroquinate dehydratase [Pseudomonadota bacterium]